MKLKTVESLKLGDKLIFTFSRKDILPFKKGSVVTFQRIERNLIKIFELPTCSFGIDCFDVLSSKNVLTMVGESICEIKKKHC